MADKKVGRIVQIIGPVLDVEFEAGHLPEIYNALRVHAETTETGVIDVIAEVDHILKRFERGQARARRTYLDRPLQDDPDTLWGVPKMLQNPGKFRVDKVDIVTDVGNEVIITGQNGGGHYEIQVVPSEDEEDSWVKVYTMV